MYITRKCEAGISSDDMLYPIQNTEIFTEEQKSGMGFIMTLFLLKKYLKRNGRTEELDIVYVYREILEELRSEKVSQYVKNFRVRLKNTSVYAGKMKDRRKKL